MEVGNWHECNEFILEFLLRCTKKSRELDVKYMSICEIFQKKKVNAERVERRFTICRG